MNSIKQDAKGAASALLSQLTMQDLFIIGLLCLAFTPILGGFFSLIYVHLFVNPRTFKDDPNHRSKDQ